MAFQGLPPAESPPQPLHGYWLWDKWGLTWEPISLPPVSLEDFEYKVWIQRGYLLAKEFGLGILEFLHISQWGGGNSLFYDITEYEAIVLILRMTSVIYTAFETSMILKYHLGIWSSVSKILLGPFRVNSSYLNCQFICESAILYLLCIINIVNNINDVLWYWTWEGKFNFKCILQIIW